ncbi:MAG TPA: hypothetical protein PLT47_07710 [Bacteroidales bacterium]|nr:hypothetical protein [Bacteroidales bacterium]HQI70621.1 hypothetical protein [Bacteroidales bacterium]
MKNISFCIAVILLATVSFAQKIDKSQVPPAVKLTYFNKIHDTVSMAPAWELTGEVYKASFVKGEMTANVSIKQSGEWVKTIWTIPYQYVPQKIKDNVATSYAGFKVMKSSIQYRADGDYYVIDIKKKKDVKVLLYNLKSEFIKLDSDLISPVPVPKP